MHFSPNFTATLAALFAKEISGVRTTYSLERGVQACILRDLIGNPFRPKSITTNWLTPTILSMGQAAYQCRILPSGELDTARLAVLADALEDRGCDNDEIMGHLRSPGPHFRGCFALDLILGKE